MIPHTVAAAAPVIVGWSLLALVLLVTVAAVWAAGDWTRAGGQG